jgi:predicted MFS family arabinose efflux permease
VAEQGGGAAAEWRKYWFLPLVAGMGYATSALQSYGFGPFFQPLQDDFGWTRAEVATGITISNLGAAIVIPFVGPLIDRYGPRLLGIVGVSAFLIAYGLLSVATGTHWDWWLHWAGIAVATACLQGTVWTGAVVSRFLLSRGMAIGVTVSGLSVAIAILPPLSTWLIINHGWRGGFLGIAIIWAIVVLPMLFLFFRGAQDDLLKDRREGIVAEHVELPGIARSEGLRSPAFYKLLFISFTFAFCTIASVIHFVPMLGSFGATPMGAAGVAAIIGIASIFGRLGTGVLLDRLPAHLVGFVVYLIPVAGSAALIVDGTNITNQIIAAIALGLTVGGEADVIVYLVTRHFGLRSFGTLMSACFASMAFGSAAGPYVAAMIFDGSGDYFPYIWLTVGLTTASAIILLGLRCPPLSATSAKPA